MSSIWIGLCLCFSSIYQAASYENGTIEAVSVDTCMLQSAYPNTLSAYSMNLLSRAVTPSKAGREGLSLGEKELNLQYNNSYIKEMWSDPTQPISYGIKFYAIITQKTYFHNFLKTDDLGVALLRDGTIGIQYKVGQQNRLHRTGIPMPLECSKPPGEKRTTNEGNCWKLIGVAFNYDRKTAHLDVYVNGKKITRITFPRNGETPAVMKHPLSNKIVIAKGWFSCIEVTQGDRPQNYYEDFDLNECQRKYDGEPGQKFVNCLSNFKTPQTQQHKRGWLDHLPDYSMLFRWRDPPKKLYL